MPPRTDTNTHRADAEARLTVWQRLGRPIQALVWVGIAAGVIVIYNGASGLFGHLFSVILLFIFAAVIALLLTPVIDFMQRASLFRSHRSVAVLALYLAIFAVIGGIMALVTPNLVDQARHVPQLVSQLQRSLADHGITVDLNSLVPSAVSLGSTINIVTSVAATVVAIVLVVVISFYLLADGRALIATLRNLFPENTHRFDFTMVATGSVIAAYMRGQLLMSLIIGSYTALALSLIGVHYAIVIGVAAFLLEFVPIIGAVIAMALGVVVALLQSPLLALLAGIAGLVGHALEAYVIGPRVSGHVTKLHPLVAMAALLIGAEAAGILGALFAVPLAAMANIFLGAFYRSRRGDVATTTADSGVIEEESLPRLGEEISAVEEEGVVAEPVPHGAAKG
ncbi:MAG TPA: AI-2E family transporter [Candidatus Acidoferrales bacterium]|nr:AI-2E family transporter [Candidatus Acidoferrales bacterium]